MFHTSYIKCESFNLSDMPFTDKIKLQATSTVMPSLMCLDGETVFHKAVWLIAVPIRLRLTIRWNVIGQQTIPVEVSTVI